MAASSQYPYHGHLPGLGRLAIISVQFLSKVPPPSVHLYSLEYTAVLEEQRLQPYGFIRERGT